jgi:hypothetical protein
MDQHNGTITEVFMDLIWFEWWNCKTGYEVVELEAEFIDVWTTDDGEFVGFHKAKDAPKWVSKLLDLYDDQLNNPDHFHSSLMQAGPKFVVADKIQEEDSYRLRSSSAIFRELADTDPTTDGVKQFAGKYGLLEGTSFLGPRNPNSFDIEPFSLWIREINDLNRMVKKWDAAKKKNNTHSFVEIFNDHVADFNGGMTVQLGQNANDDQPGLRLTPKTLRSAIWLNFAQAVAENQKFKKCEECPNWFEIGPRGGRPEKVFCSNVCQMRAYRKRAKTKKEKKT